MRKILSILLVLSALSRSPLFAKIEILNPWIRPSTGPNAALFMEVVNTSEKPISLVSAQSDASSHMELHQHIEENGRMHMSQVKSFKIPGQGKLILAPGDLHVMFMGINRPFSEAETIHVTLSFDEGENIEISVPVKNGLGSI
ncbi:MAG: copper chaperone PCu(A)C [Alphaproteobacteria bacterium]|nr:copper chaperone PCu(A)C [Alphaproteobacteria bacterium]